MNINIRSVLPRQRRIPLGTISRKNTRLNDILRIVNTTMSLSGLMNNIIQPPHYTKLITQRLIRPNKGIKKDMNVYKRRGEI